jgi:hypothetical protein
VIGALNGFCIKILGIESSDSEEECLAIENAPLKEKSNME